MKKFILALMLVLFGCSNSQHNSPSKHSIKGPLVIDQISIEGSPYTREELLAPIFSSMIAQENEGLPFDEPRHEYGMQLDGKLRPYWLKAYFEKKRLYAFTGDIYLTMSRNTPLVPQVCADFIVDTLDRAAGTWYNKDLKHPRRYLGKFDFRKQMEDEKYNPRSAGQLINFFKSHPDDFKIIFDGMSDLEVGKVDELKTWFKDNNLQIGDIVIIRGKAPWDHGKEIHWHSFFVTRLDEQGKVSMLMGNAGKPREWTLEREVSRAPKRHVVAVIRMTNHFLMKYMDN